MSDRLTQLQTCLDQLVEQFNATVNYVNVHSEPALLDEDPKSAINIATKSPLPGQQPPQTQGSTNNEPSSKDALATDAALDDPSARLDAENNFDNTISELSTDIILKSRQISMLIDSLPGIGISPNTQLSMITDLLHELDEVEKQRIEKIEEKDKLLKWCESLIIQVATGISETKE